MCKQHDLYFDCGHKIACRLSTCRFQKGGVSRSGKRWRACMSYAYIARDICSSCYSTQFKTKIEFEVETRRLGMIGEYEEDELAELEAWKTMLFERIESYLPRRQATQPTRSTPRQMSWQSRKHTKRTTSLLRNEFKPEDVIGHESWESRLVTDGDVAIETSGTTWIGDWDDSDDDDTLISQASDSASDSSNDTDNTELDETTDAELCAMLDDVHDSIFGNECQAFT
ncbi:hypothetical protein AMS68_006820 [Peltaster fructicola]|uniref:Uncharacterized protein n=1 Tax=Peltaster fructicola TaxID=286661 RepID=A0A6H0Y2R0_9PEZI|nr:hypothetical protein AMS68_006820 [Peltaster fructicola]